MLEVSKLKPLDVAVMGRATIDIYANEIGSLIEAKSFNKYIGGSAANTAVALSRLGLDVGYIGKVSSDPLGEFILKYLRNENIDISNIKKAKKGINSGITIGEIYEDSCNCYMYRNNCADIHIEPCDIDESYISKYKILLISGTSLSRSPARESVFYATKLAKRNGTKVFLDIDFRENTWENHDKAGIYLTLAANQADAIIGTKQEYEVMTNLLYDEVLSSSEIAKKFIEIGSKVVVIKNGEKGSELFSDEGVYKGGIFPTAVLKTFGAGDAYAAGLVYGLLNDFPIEEILKFAAACSSITIMGHSCSDAMPSLDEVESYLVNNRYTN